MIYSALISFVSQFLGAFLAKHNPEEMKPGKKYFMGLEILILFGLVVVGFYFSEFIWWMLLIGVLLGMLFKYEYLYFGLLVMLDNYLIYTLLFVYGLPYGTLKFVKGKFIELVFNTLLFFIPILIVWYFKIDIICIGLGGIVGMLAWKVLRRLK